MNLTECGTARAVLGLFVRPKSRVVNRFPDTKQTLIRRIASDPESTDWSVFVNDYWSPLVRFASVRGGLNFAEAEDVASEAFEVLFKNDLLARWLGDRRAKLRTVLCGVAKNLLSNRARIQRGRDRVMSAITPNLLAIATQKELGPDDDCFYEIWVVELLQKTLSQIQRESVDRDRLDEYRVFHGKIVDGMSNQELADCLGLKLTDVENYYKSIRNRFSKKLRQVVETQVQRYGAGESFEDEFAIEWHALRDHLKSRGTIETILRQAAVAPQFQLGQESNTKTTTVLNIQASLKARQSGNE